MSDDKKMFQTDEHEHRLGELTRAYAEAWANYAVCDPNEDYDKYSKIHDAWFAARRALFEEVEYRRTARERWLKGLEQKAFDEWTTTDDIEAHLKRVESQLLSYLPNEGSDVFPRRPGQRVTVEIIVRSMTPEEEAGCHMKNRVMAEDALVLYQTPSNPRAFYEIVYPPMPKGQTR